MATVIEVMDADNLMMPLFQLCFCCVGDRTGPDGGDCPRCHGTGLDPHL